MINYSDTRVLEALFSKTFFETLLRVLKCKWESNVDSPTNERNFDYLKLFKERFKFRKLIHLDEVNTERIMIAARIIFFQEIVMLASEREEKTNLMTFLNRTISLNYSSVLRGMVCTRRFVELTSTAH